MSKTQIGRFGNCRLAAGAFFKFLIISIQAAAILNATYAVAEDPASASRLKIRLSFGHQVAEKSIVAPRVIAGSPDMEVRADQKVLVVGEGQTAEMLVEVSWKQPTDPPREIQSIWKYLLENGEAGQIARLSDDGSLQPGAPVLTVELSSDGTRGFSIGLTQLVRHKAMWLPEHHAFVTLDNEPVEFEQHLQSLRGERILDKTKREPEATYEEWSRKWLDFGDPLSWKKTWETSWMGTRGHLTEFVARHGSRYKFAIDRWSSVRPDMASPHKFRFDPIWPNATWDQQRIVDGFPILLTELERDGQQCNVEQFAAALSEDAPLVRGEVASVLLTKLRFSGRGGSVNFAFGLSTENPLRHPELREVAGQVCVVDRETDSIWLMLEGNSGYKIVSGELGGEETNPRIEITCTGVMSSQSSIDVVAKLASPALPMAKAAQLASLNFDTARASTLQYWHDWLAQGAEFDVPEQVVNDLYRANLWHALALPRHRTDERGVDRIDLPYSNLAYGQYNADWPINQAVYVDYMLYGLRGYYAVAEAEFAAMYHTQQKDDGRISGYAEWGVYTPSMLYAIGQNFLLSNDRDSFDRLLPQSMKALDWCLSQIAQAQDNALPGVILAPLNDLTHDSRAWAFPNAYFVAGVEVFGRALIAYGHPRAEAVLSVAHKMREDVTAAFARASVKSPVVQLADGSWINYVPCDALTPRRTLEEWYPTDVDCGPLHLSRLAVIDPNSWMTTAMLHDHEDNLFLEQKGMANEPIYNQQATSYLYRDEPEAAIRAFYSMLTCAFSHHQLTPLEHRWAWGQYYMPPSTDGAWFELYRNMLINELAGNETLFIGQAIPRKWLAAGKTIKLTNAPSYFGPVNLNIISSVDRGSIRAELEFLSARRPQTVRLRLRHPTKQTTQSVTLNGAEWTDFDVEKEWVQIPAPVPQRVILEANY